ncbi:hypothetical protein Dimus_008339, partial [Dionaea muscipula]
KRDIAGFLDLTYMEYLMHGKLVNFPRLIIRHMAHVIRTPNHELPFDELLTRIFKVFDVPLDKKDVTQPVETDLFKESFLHKCGLKRENGIWWLRSGENIRRDEEESDLEEESDEEESDSEDEEKTSSKQESTLQLLRGNVLNQWMISLMLLIVVLLLMRTMLLLVDILNQLYRRSQDRAP